LDAVTITERGWRDDALLIKKSAVETVLINKLKPMTAPLNHSMAARNNSSIRSNLHIHI
jgi:hypothetical protein